VLAMSSASWPTRATAVNGAADLGQRGHAVGMGLAVGEGAGERIVGNLHRVYADLGAAKAEVDTVAALRDMVADNHGRPLSCFA
jgi:hypothetical protein